VDHRANALAHGVTLIRGEIDRGAVERCRPGLRPPQHHSHGPSTHRGRPRSLWPRL